MDPNKTPPREHPIVNVPPPLERIRSQRIRRPNRGSQRRLIFNHIQVHPNQINLYLLP